ncbi:hypothetical protein CAPTEDRAFT_186703 [Capitella teleta]|uniref:Uncharacterized protein n=1 Tax=Capitella teleta TaxID=283909 RepID=R7TQN3_CAPTE|nr:hypothetical protein CAPTEDRAFT_186703 [Capitella teleta]|eukprot:ELT95979.1 hypothetical protein CAPTEDRAFT_186703 [Capitella teleta]
MTQQQKQAKKKMEKEKKDITEAYNRRAKQYRELSLHEPVYVQLDPSHAQWQQATITRTPNEEQPRSYEVQLPSGATYSRSRKFIRPDQSKPLVPSKMLHLLSQGDQRDHDVLLTDSITADLVAPIDYMAVYISWTLFLL